MQTCQVHKPLIQVLSKTDDTQLLHAALGFLKNLALPPKNKPELGSAGLVDVLPRLWKLESVPQIQYSSISLARQLIIGCWENVKRICSRLSYDPDSPAHQRSQLSVLHGIFIRTDAEPIKMEIARLLTAICRVYNSPNTNIPDLDHTRRAFFDRHPDLGLPLSFMVSQKKWPVVRSEGWFVFALMARTPEGAQCVSDLMHDIAVFQPLVELLTGKNIIEGKVMTPTTSPETSPNDLNSPAESSSQSSPTESYSSPTNPNMQGLPTPGGTYNNAISAGSGTPSDAETEMHRIDRENALVLVSELLRNMGGHMALMRRTVFEDLLKGGSAMHLDYKDLKARSELDDNFLYNRSMGANFNVAEVVMQGHDEMFG